MTAKHLVSFAVAVLVAGTLSAGCGGDKAGDDAESVVIRDESGNGMTMKFRGEDGETAEVEIGGDNETFSMRVDGGAGGYQMQVGAAAEIPKDFPKDVPLYKGLALGLSQSSEDGFVIQGTVEDEIEQVSAFYRDRAAAEGWEEESSFTQSGDQPLTMLNYKKDDRTLNVSIGREDGNTSVMLAADR